jgi:hypothetical protein
VPVAYGDAQVSVPSSFDVVYPGQTNCDVIPALQLGRPSAVLCGGSVSGRGATTIQILVAVLPPRLSASPYLVINGLRLYTLEERSSGTLGYYSPALGSEVLGSGPLAGRILRTLTHSVESQPVVYEPAVI